MLLTAANASLDSYTYIARGGVFANVQTGNVIFFGLNMSQGKLHDALDHAWPILAFLVGIAVASYLKSGRVHRYLTHPLRWAMLLQAIVLAAIGFVPATVPHNFVTVPISFVTAIQIGLFRNVGDLSYFPAATTGNMMRMVEFGYDRFVNKTEASRGVFTTYAVLILCFATGVLIGALATRAWCVHAIWLSAGFLAITLALIIFDERRKSNSV
ncbi:YoaK family protein [Mycobacterium spongiae]|uniref:DUF1275 domain-containing protein n=1 Tax=Mycobacterium spongiae TaxID=886343 RepID=A0A975K1R9_9MYCO|nr:DUF1275 domain-containing protein [Mycobacterium spongiae]